MSRVGKHPVTVPEGVTVNIEGQRISAKGKLGERAIELHEEISAELKDGEIWVRPRQDTKEGRKLWGTTRSVIQNLVKGVGEGFTVNLEIVGIGYRAQVSGDTLSLQLGYSHDVQFPIPEGIDVTCERPTRVTIAGADRQQVGQVAANIRALRVPEPYKGKGIRYENEYVRRKEGKKK